MYPNKRWLIFFLGFILISCNSTRKTADGTDEVPASPEIRKFASVNGPMGNVNPQSGKTFWQEYQEASRKPSLLKPKLQVFGKWVRANPVATFTDILANSPVLEMESLPIEKDFQSPPPNGSDSRNSDVSNPQKNVEPSNYYPYKDTVVLTRYKDVVEALNQPTKLSVRNYRKKMENSIGHYMLAYDGSQYNIKEKPWMRQMLPQSDLPRVRQIVRNLVSKAIQDEAYVGKDPSGMAFGRLELVNQVARRVPIELTGEYFGFPGPSREKMYEWSRATQDDYFHNVGNEKEARRAARVAGKEMHEYLKALIQQKQQEIAGGRKSDDVLSRLIRGGTQEFVAPTSEEDDRIRNNIIGTLVGGVETTQAAIVQSINQFFMRPEIFAQVRAAAMRDDVETVGKYIWEVLRFHPVNPFVVRYAEEDLTLSSGVKIAKGSHVLVSTQAAMLDPAEFESPTEFRLNRDQNKFFHLGYGHHRCLGDYVSMVQVPEIVMAILKLPGLRPASGHAGTLDFRLRPRADKKAATKSFPEFYSVEFDAKAIKKSATVMVANSAYSYEDYLMNFDRPQYRACLAGLPQSTKMPKALVIPGMILRNLEVNKINTATQENRELLYCRLNAEFRSCMTQQQKDLGRFEILQTSVTHAKAYEICAQKANLTSTEKAFYEHVMLDKKLNTAAITPDQAVRSTGKDYEFEDYLKFYNRYNYRECFLNPAGLSSFQDRDMIMYARLNLDFRMCMGKPVLAHKVTKGAFGSDRETTYEKCKDGVYNELTFKKEGALSRTEKYLYETLVLGRNVRFEDIQ